MNAYEDAHGVRRNVRNVARYQEARRMIRAEFQAEQMRANLAVLGKRKDE